MSAEPVHVGVLVATAIDALLGAAAGHMGDPLPDGRLVEVPSPVQAWLALTAVAALLDEVGPLAREEAMMPFRAGFTALSERFWAANPTFQPLRPASEASFAATAEAIVAMLE